MQSSRLKAQLLGKRTYWSGKPCKRGHYAERSVSSGNCLVCKKEDEQRNLKGKLCGDCKFYGDRKYMMDHCSYPLPISAENIGMVMKDEDASNCPCFTRRRKNANSNHKR